MEAVTILSGGLDSSTLLYYIMDKYNVDPSELSALTFDYGQRHRIEISRARLIAKEAGVQHHVINLRDITELISNSALTGNIEVPEVPETAEHYETLKQTVVPNRNAIMLSIAYGHAVNVGAKYVAYGAHASDRDVYPDCRIEFVDALNYALSIGNWSKRWDLVMPTIIAPFVNMPKSTVVMLGDSFGVPFGLTWSCYKGGEKHCGVCSSCRERKRAFQEVGVVDPTVYER